MLLEIDEFDKGERLKLNYGHTFGHAYEAALGYKLNLNHGEAVILGIKTVLNFSYKKNILKEPPFILGLFL